MGVFGQSGTRRVFHVLDEREPFSEYAGGAISRWVGNVVRRDASSIAVCKSSDASWKVPAPQVRVAPGYDLFSRLTSRITTPLEARYRVGALVLRRALHDLSEGDVVWVHNRPEFCFGLNSFVRSRKAKLVLHLHNSILEWKRDEILRSLKLDRVVFVSDFLRRATLEKYHALGVASVIYNGSDDELFRPGPERLKRAGEPLSVIFASRLAPEKGAHVLMQAVLQLNDLSVPLQVKVIGSNGFGKNTTSDYIRGLHGSAPGNVEFLGYQPSSEVARHLRNADVFCLPSVWDDPFPLAPLEAMASGVPVIATRSGGIPEAFQWGGAILVQKNSPDELARALKQAASEPGVLQKLSREGLASFRQHFTWPDVIRQFRGVAESL